MCEMIWISWRCNFIIESQSEWIALLSSISTETPALSRSSTVCYLLKVLFIVNTATIVIIVCLLSFKNAILRWNSLRFDFFYWFFQKSTICFYENSTLSQMQYVYVSLISTQSIKPVSAVYKIDISYCSFDLPSMLLRHLRGFDTRLGPILFCIFASLYFLI